MIRRLVAAVVTVAILAAPLTAFAEEYATPFPPRAGQQTLVTPRGIAPDVPRFLAYTDYEDGDPIPTGYHKEQRVRGGLVGAGIGTFAGMWALTALLGCTFGAPALAAPFIGPVVAAASSHDAPLMIAGAIDGVIQLAGLGMFVAGIAAPRVVLVPDGGAAFTVAPMVGSSTGAMVSGTF